MKIFRVIVPVYPRPNIFTGQAKKMTSLGAIIVATVANKLLGWRVEVIDENNYRGPRDNNGLPDHEALQRQSSADVVGFYCGLSSTMPRVWQLAKLYHGWKVCTIAGGWHVYYCPQETLRKDIDIVIHGDGEVVIQQVLRTIAEDGCVENVPGISFLKKNGDIQINNSLILENHCLDDLPFPDFGLLKWSEKIKIYSIGRTRGCSMNCEFCSVKGKPRSASAKWLFDFVCWLVETRRARNFFIVDDRIEEDINGTLDFFKMIAEKYGRRLNLTVQVRLGAAENVELLTAMKNAGVRVVCIGYESPVDENLKAMHKGYSSSKMIEWTRVYKEHGFRIHGMFIFGYPSKDGKDLIKPVELVKRFKRFIRKARIDTIQVLLPIPLPGTGLRRRLEVDGRVFSPDKTPWEYYDGNFPCFQPDGTTPRELQEGAMKIMANLYSKLNLALVFLRTITFPAGYLIQGWEEWYHGWRRDVLRSGGYFIIGKWRSKQDNEELLKRLEQ